MILSISKKRLFDIFKKNGFVYGKKCISSSLQEITDEIYKNHNILVKICSNLSKTFENELQNIKRKWNKLKGGNQRAHFLHSMNDQCFTFEAEIMNSGDDFEQNINTGNSFYIFCALITRPVS